MSACFSLDDREWLLNFVKDSATKRNIEEALIECFAQQTQYDIAMIEKQLKKEEYLKKLCFYKLILFPIEYVLTWVVFGRQQARDKSKINVLYKQFYKKKISLSKFETQLNLYISELKLI